MDTNSDNFVVGIRQSKRLIDAGMASKAYIAKDVDPYISDPFVKMCVDNGVDIEYIESKSSLGKICKIDVDASVVVIKKEVI